MWSRQIASYDMVVKTEVGQVGGGRGRDNPVGTRGWRQDSGGNHRTCGASTYFSSRLQPASPLVILFYLVGGSIYHKSTKSKCKPACQRLCPFLGIEVGLPLPCVTFFLIVILSPPVHYSETHHNHTADEAPQRWDCATLLFVAYSYHKAFLVHS
jgi:hypothetical protein